MRATRRSTPLSAMASRYAVGDQAELADQAEVVEPSPALDDAAVADPEHVDPVERDRAAGGRHAHDLAALSAAGGELLHDQVTLADEQAGVGVPVGEGRPEHGAGSAHALAVRGRPERRVMVDEVLGEEDVDRAEVSLGEQLVDELADDGLVLLDGCHVAMIRRPGCARYPNNLGFGRGRTLPYWGDAGAGSPHGHHGCSPAGPAAGRYQSLRRTDQSSSPNSRRGQGRPG